MNANENNKPRPSFGGSYGHGWRTMSKYFLILLLVSIVTGLVMMPMGMGDLDFESKFNIEHFSDIEHFDCENIFHEFFNSPEMAVLGAMSIFLGILAIAYGLLVIPVFKFGKKLIFVHAARDIRPEFDILIRGFKENYLHIILASLLRTALIMMGMIFCIVPGIIVACRLAFVPYLVMDKKMDPIVAVEESWKLTKGHGWTIFFMGFVSFFIALFGLILFFVGIIPAGMWINSAFASLYEAVSIKKNEKVELA
jgi:hypothetical protein